MDMNIMMDPVPLYPNLYHPFKRHKTMDLKRRAKHYSRTSRPTRYFIIDFGLSRQYDPADGPPLEYPIWGGDKTVPEFQVSDEACDPFPTDIYYLGNMIRLNFLQVCFKFIRIRALNILSFDHRNIPIVGFLCLL